MAMAVQTASIGTRARELRGRRGPRSQGYVPRRSLQLLSAIWRARNETARIRIALCACDYADRARNVIAAATVSFGAAPGRRPRQAARGLAGRRMQGCRGERRVYAVNEW